MKINLRNNIFETNSSSTHAMCISKKDCEYEKVDSVKLTDGYFGWEGETYNDFETKANYVFTYIMTGNNDVVYNLKILLETISDVTGIDIDNIKPNYPFKYE